MRILIVEDHTDTRQLMARLLSGWGFEVVAAENLEDGLNFTATKTFDVIISDIALPDGTGYALISDVRRRGKNVLAIALSGYDYPSDVQVAKLTGFDHHLRKPCDSEQLRALLQESVRSKSLTDDSGINFA